MNLYLYRLADFNFEDENEYDEGFEDEYDEDFEDEDDEDEEDERFPRIHEDTHVLETKLKDTVPLAYGYFHIGYNFLEIYPYSFVAFPMKSVMIFDDRESEGELSLVVPYQNKKLAKKTYSKWLREHGFGKAADAVERNPVTNLSRLTFVPDREDLAYAKRWDAKMIAERNEAFFSILRKNREG